MSIHIVVDGYNIIYQSSWLGSFNQQNMQFRRGMLLAALGAYRKLKGYRVTVVFDGTDIASLYPQRDIINGIEIRFSRNDETADQIINEIAMKEKQRAMVVSCDREIISFAESCGATVIQSHVFEKKILIAIDSLFVKPTRIRDDLDKSKFITRKKGPSKRLPKNKRRHRVRIKKL